MVVVQNFESLEWVFPFNHAGELPENVMWNWPENCFGGISSLDEPTAGHILIASGPKLPMSYNSENDLIERIKKGDPSGFEAIVLRYQDRIHNLCRYMLQDPRDAQDAAQDVFLKAYRGHERLQTGRIPLHMALPDRRKHLPRLQEKITPRALKKQPLTEDLPSTDPSRRTLRIKRDRTESITKGRFKSCRKSRGRPLC